MSKSAHVWLHGLMAALIGGGASAVVSGITVSAFDPAKFNFGQDIVRLLEFMAVQFGLSGILSVFAYLKQSPLPPDEDCQP